MQLAEKSLPKPAAPGHQDDEHFDERMRQAFREAIAAGDISPVPEPKLRTQHRHHHAAGDPAPVVGMLDTHAGWEAGGGS